MPRRCVPVSKWHRRRRSAFLLLLLRGLVAVVFLAGPFRVGNSSTFPLLLVLAHQQQQDGAISTSTTPSTTLDVVVAAAAVEDDVAKESPPQQQRQQPAESMTEPQMEIGQEQQVERKQQQQQNDDDIPSENTSTNDKTVTTEDDTANNSGSINTDGNTNDGNHDNDDDDSMVFSHFVAHNKTMTCTADVHARFFNNQVRGVNLGGWMVLEPWITPSLFYQFLGGTENTTAFDTYTFCQVLGPVEANRQLRRHWQRWVTEDIIKTLANSGAVNSMRVPVGDYMYQPYGPYAVQQNGTTCFDGALEFVDLLLDWAYSHGLTVMIDIHTARDSQNGFDNSGQALGFQWTSALSREFVDQLTFQHWPIREARWMGHFDHGTATYPKINHANIRHSLNVIAAIADRYAGHPAIVGLEPLNEPWAFCPIDILKRFYWEGYLIVKKRAPYWKYLMHDSFRFDPNIWGGFMDGCPERALDTHIYQAWRNPDSRIGYYTDACSQKRSISAMERAFGPVIVGEWSLATDNCAMWLNGFNDNLPGFPRLPCKYQVCAKSYLENDKDDHVNETAPSLQPGVPIDPSQPIQGPFGTGMSGPIFGLCPSDRDWIKESSGDPLTGRDWIKAPPQAPRRLDDTDNVMTHLALKKIDAFSGIGHGFYFWNFRTDLDEPQWSYMAALERGWIPRGSLMNDPRIDTACAREDSGEYRCVLKKGQVDFTIRNALLYILNSENLTDTPQGQEKLNLKGSALRDATEEEITNYFDKNRKNGATCDFGGIAMLVEINRTISDDDSISYTDDEYFGYIVVRRGPPLWWLVVFGTLIGLLLGVLGFIVAMRKSKTFNYKIRKASFFRPFSQNSLVRSSLNLTDLDDYGGVPLRREELEQLIKLNDDF